MNDTISIIFVNKYIASGYRWYNVLSFDAIQKILCENIIYLINNVCVGVQEWKSKEIWFIMSDLKNLSGLKYDLIALIAPWMDLKCLKWRVKSLLKQKDAISYQYQQHSKERLIMLESSFNYIRKWRVKWQ